MFIQDNKNVRGESMERLTHIGKMAKLRGEVESHAVIATTPVITWFGVALEQKSVNA
jgi:hypothetical protein